MIYPSSNVLDLSAANQRKSGAIETGAWLGMKNGASPSVDIDYGKIYVSGGDLYYINPDGDVVQMTNGASAAGGGTLDDAYDYGGAGAGRQINVDSGQVELIGTGPLLGLKSSASEGDAALYVMGIATPPSYVELYMDETLGAEQCFVDLVTPSYGIDLYVAESGVYKSGITANQDFAINVSGGTLYLPVDALSAWTTGSISMTSGTTMSLISNGNMTIQSTAGDVTITSGGNIKPQNSIYDRLYINSRSTPNSLPSNVGMKLSMYVDDAVQFGSTAPEAYFTVYSIASGVTVNLGIGHYFDLRNYGTINSYLWGFYLVNTNYSGGLITTDNIGSRMGAANLSGATVSRDMIGHQIVVRNEGTVSGDIVFLDADVWVGLSAPSGNTYLIRYDNVDLDYYLYIRNGSANKLTLTDTYLELGRAGNPIEIRGMVPRRVNMANINDGTLAPIAEGEHVYNLYDHQAYLNNDGTATGWVIYG